jgi:predicted ArsR family transcriptional regulator
MGMTDEPGLAPPDAIRSQESGDGKGMEHREAWKDETASVDRVISVAMSLEQPRTAEWVSEQAEVSPTTARDHLDRLVELRVLGSVEQRGAKTYYPDAAYQRFKEVSELVQEHSREELQEIVIQAKEWIQELETEYDVEDPAELRSLATVPDTSAKTAKECFKRASEWDSHRHMLSVAEEALDRYEEFGQQHHLDHGAPAPS